MQKAYVSSQTVTAILILLCCTKDYRLASIVYWVNNNHCFFVVNTTFIEYIHSLYSIVLEK